MDRRLRGNDSGTSGESETKEGNVLATPEGLEPPTLSSED